MKRLEKIILHLGSVGQLIDPCAVSPFLKRRLKEEAEKFIVERAAALPADGVELILFLPESEAEQARGVPTAFRQHFAFRREEAEGELRRLRRFGWRSLVKALVFLSLTILLVELIKRYLPSNHFSTLLQEGLTILAWIALWRPGELLLYDWYPFSRDARLFDKLERAELQVITQSRPGLSCGSQLSPEDPAGALRPACLAAVQWTGRPR